MQSNATRLYSFGRGLASGPPQKREIFEEIRSAFVSTEPDARRILFIKGFLAGCAQHDRATYEAILDDVVRDEVLGIWFPDLQTAWTIDSRGVERLHEALDLGLAPVHAFERLAWGRAHETISDDQLVALLRKILTKEGGVDVAIEILNMRFHGKDRETTGEDPAIMQIARETLLIWTQTVNEHDRITREYDYKLSSMANRCLNTPASRKEALAIMCGFVEANKQKRLYSFAYPSLIASFARTQPDIFLDEFLVSLDDDRYEQRWIFTTDPDEDKNPLEAIDEDVILSWCQADPGVRYPILASSINPLQNATTNEGLQVRPIVYSMIDNAPDVEVVLDRLAERIWPMSWSGSRADVLARRGVLFQELFTHDNSIVRTWARAQHAKLQHAVQAERDSEDREYRQRHERFE